MTKKLQIGLLFGGRSGEHEVSLQSARSVRSVIDLSTYDITEIGITPEGIWMSGSETLEFFEKKQYNQLTPVVLMPDPEDSILYQIRKTSNGDVLEPFTHLDIIFPVLHGTFGEDGTVQGVLELADIAYVGGGVLASSVGMDKALFNEVMRANNIPIVDSLLFNRHQIENDIQEILSQIEAALRYPVFTKPVNLGSSVGISKCCNQTELMKGLRYAATYDRRILVEQGVDAREIEVSVLGNENPRASVPGEILPNDVFYTYEAKYINDDSELLIPASIDPILACQIQETAIKAYKLIDGAGMARVDFFVERSTGKFYLSEINTIPGFTKISMYPKLWEASGLPYDELVEELIRLALQRKNDKDCTCREYHPC